MNIHLYGFKPAGLLHLVVDDRLVLIDPLISSSGEDHILDGEKEKTQIKLSNNTTVYIWSYWHRSKCVLSGRMMMVEFLELSNHQHASCSMWKIDSHIFHQM